MQTNPTSLFKLAIIFLDKLLQTWLAMKFSLFFFLYDVKKLEKLYSLLRFWPVNLIMDTTSDVFWFSNLLLIISVLIPIPERGANYLLR